LDTIWPCPAGATEVPNHLGYQYLQRLLASQGYVTVSLSANGVNGQEFDLAAEDSGMTQRSALVRFHLRRWAAWAAGGGQFGERWGGRVDMQRVLLVGHSRGGEGVARAAIDTPAGAPWRVAGQVLLAPTAFGLQQAPYVPTISVLPYCDGDVVWLSGQLQVDLGRDVVRDPALRSAVLVMGANHNFFNTEWTPRLSSTIGGDDAVSRCSRCTTARGRGFVPPVEPRPSAVPSAAGGT
jgi:pimeloyl-ACP methyl ester carboxylesterase